MEMRFATSTPEQETMPEARLWQAVIVKTIEEWISGPLRRRRDAEKFLFSDNTDFRLVCQSAGMDAESLRTRLAKLRKQSQARVSCQVAA
jgi:hypothetical protein